MTSNAAQDGPTAEKDRWKGLVLSSMLRSLHKKAQKLSGRKITKEQQQALDLARGSKLDSFNTTLSQAKAFVVDSGESLIGLMMKNGGSGAHSREVKALLNSAIRVEKAIAGEEKALGIFLPEFTGDVVKRWPGPVGYRVALNHLVAVSIRIHSIFPSAGFGLVVGLVSKAVLVPIFAHNLTFVARSHPKAFKLLMDYLGGVPNKGVEVGDDHDEEDKELYQKWVCLLVCLDEFAPTSFDMASARREILDLVNERGDNLASSRLWSGLSVFASGDLAVDELLVAKMIKENEASLGSAVNKPLVNCARSRFGLLRYSYAMETERDLLRSNWRLALERVKDVRKEVVGLSRPEYFDENLAKKAFGWAYLLSRRILLGRKEDEVAGAKECHDLSKALDELLTSMSDRRFLNSQQARAYGALALRYRAGFRSNPRFIADTNGNDVNGYIETVIPLLKAVPEISLGITYMVKARNALHTSYVRHLSGNQKGALLELDHAIAHYGMTLDSIMGARFAFDDESKQPPLPNVEGVMDGEVAAWCIPEMVAALRMREEWSATRAEKESLRRLYSALAVVGEVQFGVYFNQEDEVDRIERGLKLRCRPKFR